jgi:hypothetical protein
MNIDIVNPLDIPDWDEQILRLPGYSFFHCSAWARVLSESYGYKPLYFTIFNGNAISACLPMMEVNSIITGKRGVSLPFSDCCEPLIGEGVDFQELFESVVNYGMKAGWKYVELRGGKPFLGDAKHSMIYHGHKLELKDGPERLLSRFRDSTKRNIKKAEKEGVIVVVSNSIDAVQQFGRLNSISRKRHGLPPQPVRFFTALQRHVLSKDLGFVVLASHGRDVTAGAIFLLFGRKALFKYGAFDEGKQRVRPNNLVMWKAIKLFSENEFETLDFGRTELEHTGLAQFKTGWRPTEHQITYYRYNVNDALFSNSSQAISRANRGVFRNMPSPLLNLIGSLAYKHMG